MAEIRIAAFVAEHNIAIAAVDHLVALIKKLQLNEDSIKQLTCNRTKCTALINNVIGESSFESLVNNLRNQKFSLLVVESTDHSSIKNLAVVVRINNNFNISDNFLALLPVSDASAQNLYNTITDFFNSNAIPFKDKMIGFVADAMMGSRHSLKTLLAKDIPTLFSMKCICHSLALCASYASAKNCLESLKN